VSIFKNRYAIPFGVVYHQWTDSSTFAGMSAFTKDRTLLNAVVLHTNAYEQSQALQKMQVGDTLIPFTFEYYAEMTGKLKQDTLALSEYSENRLTGKVSSTGGPGILMLPMSFDTGWQITLNGKPIQAFIVNAGLTGIRIPEGVHDINMEYSVVNLQQTVWLSLLGFIMLAAWIFVEYTWITPVKKEKGSEDALNKA
jgi:uncharacterized membrane protein YfhO